MLGGTAMAAFVKQENPPAIHDIYDNVWADNTSSADAMPASYTIYSGGDGWTYWERVRSAQEHAKRVERAILGMRGTGG